MEYQSFAKRWTTNEKFQRIYNRKVFPMTRNFGPGSKLHLQNRSLMFIRRYANGWAAKNGISPKVVLGGQGETIQRVFRRPTKVVR